MERESEAAPRRSATLTGDEPPEAIGAYLSRQRRLRGISLEALHDTTQIPLRSLERLEAGVFDKKPDGFVRGLVRTVAEALGLDPAETVTRMLNEPSPAAEPGLLGSLSWQQIALLSVIGLGFVVGLSFWIAWLGDEQDARPPTVMSYRRDAVRDLLRQVESNQFVSPAPSEQETPAPSATPAQASTHP